MKKLLFGEKNECAFSAARLKWKQFSMLLSINEFGSSKMQIKAIVRTSSSKGKICISVSCWWCFHTFMFILLSNRLHWIQWPNSDPFCISFVFIEIYRVRYQFTVKCTEASLISLKSQGWDSTEKPLLLFCLRLVFLDPRGMVMLHLLDIYTNLLFQYSDLKIKIRDCVNEVTYVRHGKRGRRKHSLPLPLGLLML